ncbi:outer membrane protein assembly factor BamE [Yersinia sp. Marseille-Q3913]|uniref:outer membrane protein assembly factor BamE domain-containing protein n=1 Tax=Yersinia sp. Marseille-Q3913 TaxID=2830769 RepID=UPI001BAF28EA|nr:outer membrane protein assembly factor BamE [Yersinia sp. Marseille-Q3913]MBS0053904.1 outer membrane protein assembly factor BamE [Yersinia sp. Marseille-Q3913]
MKGMKTSLILLLSCLLTACVGNIDKTHATHIAKYSESEIRQKLVPNVTNKRDVLIMLGTPTNVKDYNESNHWEYRSDITDRRIYLIIPINNDRKQLLTLNFSDKGVLSDYYYSDKK